MWEYYADWIVKIAGMSIAITIIIVGTVMSFRQQLKNNQILYLGLALGLVVGGTNGLLTLINQDLHYTAEAVCRHENMTRGAAVYAGPDIGKVRCQVESEEEIYFDLRDGPLLNTWKNEVHS